MCDQLFDGWREDWLFGPRQAAEGMGAKAYGDLARMIDRHYEDWEQEFRAAPSIVCRAEIQLLGVAAPRFAFRTRIRSEYGDGIINCRRLDVLSNQLTSVLDWHWDREKQDLIQLNPADFASALDNLTSRVSRSSAIAESVLPVPGKLSSYHIITREFENTFGEDLEIKGTPFVNAIALGFGVCGHGACFMAMMMQKPWAKFVYAPSEITTIVGGDYDPDGEEGGRLRMQGLRYNEFERFFRDERVGLNTYWELGPVTDQAATADMSAASAASSGLQLLDALRSYVLSDIPVIVAVDSDNYVKLVLNDRNRLNAKVGTSETEMGERGDKEKTIYHCIVVVGTGESEHLSTFIGHDPTVGFPWLEFTAADIGNCRTDDQAVSLYPVLPKEVTMHLLPSPASKWGRIDRMGLVRIAHTLQTRSHLATLLFGERAHTVPACDLSTVGQFRLVDLERVTAGHTDVNLRELDQHGELLRSIAKTVGDVRWVWLQVASAKNGQLSLWIWSGSPDVSKADVHEYLLLVVNDISPGQPSPTAVWPPGLVLTESAEDDLPQTDSEYPIERRSPRLRPSLISSFLPTKNERAAIYWPKVNGHRVSCELYGFMLPDCDAILQQAETPTDRLVMAEPNLHECMKWVGESNTRIERLADYLSGIFPPDTQPIEAIASYIPEISAPPESTSGRLAGRALNCLCKLAIELKRNGHPIVPIELVVGSPVLGIDWLRLKNDPQHDLVVQCERKSRVRNWVLNSIEIAIEELKTDMRDHRLALAVELEPGLLNLYNTLKDGQDLMQLASDKKLDKHVGINYDIGHLAMARCLSQDQSAWDDLLSELQGHVVHCHISQHSPNGHFGDASLAQLGKSIPLHDPLLRRLLERYRDAVAARGPDELPISGLVSLELEAAVDPFSVQQSLANLCGVL